MTRRITIAGAAAAALALALLLGGVLARAGARPGRRARPAPPRRASQTGFAAGDTRSLVARARAGRSREQPATCARSTLLGLALQQRTRETADASYLDPRPSAVLRRARPARPARRLTRRARSARSRSRSTASATRSCSGAGARGSRRPRRATSASSATRSSSSAATTQAFATFDRMVALKPSLASYARVSYARELLGRRAAAIDAMELALDAAGGRPEPTAWTHVELGKLHFGQGELAAAARHYRAALAAFPGYVYALDGLARVEAARGRTDARDRARAARGRRACRCPQFVAHARRPARASRAARPRRASSTRSSARSSGSSARTASAPTSRPRSSTSTTASGSRDALARARRAHAERPSIEADDVLAWALVRNGRCGEALRFSKRALRLGTRDAAKFFHRGMAERCLGRPAAARDWFRRALALNPHFSPRLGARREEVRAMRRLAGPARAARRAARRPPPRPRTRSATSRSTATRGSSVSGDRIYALYVARPRRDPDLPGARRGAPARSRALRGRARDPAARQPDADRRRRAACRCASCATRSRSPAGVGGLRTTRLELVLDGGPARPGRRLAYADAQLPGAGSAGARSSSAARAAPALGASSVASPRA